MKMTQLKHFSPLITLWIFLGLTSCIRHTKITDLRGKVKYESINLATKIPGRVAKILVKEGQEVAKNDTLLIIDSPEVAAKYEQAQGAVQAAKAQLRMAYNGATIEQVKQIDGKLAAAEAQLAFAKASYKRLDNMFKDTLVPPQKFDEVKMKLKMAQAQVKAIKAKQKELLKGTRKEIIAQAKGQLQRALGALKEVEAAQKERFVVAPAAMRIENVTLKKGELATPGYTLVNGYLPNQIYFRFTIPESKVYQFKVNQLVTIKNPYTKKEIKAKISVIKPLTAYANITAPSESYGLSEGLYEMKMVPVNPEKANGFYQNAWVLIK